MAAAAVAAGVAGRAAWRPQPAPAWRATNYRGRPVSLSAGPALLAGALSGVAFAAPSRVRWACAVAGGGAAWVGRRDDLATGEPKGLRGHLRALASGRLTAGTVKLLVLPLSGAVAVRLLRPSPVGPGWAFDLLDGALVAACADLANLLDVAPGRALKAVGLTAVALCLPPSGTGPVAPALAGACAALLPDDLGERAMLGDCGANAGGALAGLALVVGTGPATRRGVLAVVSALILASEFVSLGEVIARAPGLGALDGWGRRGEDPGTRSVLP